MKMIVAVALALVAVVAAAPVDEPVPIVRSSSSQNPDGAFEYGFEAGNGIIQNVVGEVKQVLDEENKPHDVVVIRGSYEYPGEDGKLISVKFYADETGFHAEGDSIPKAARR